MKKYIQFILFFSSLTSWGRFAKIEEANIDIFFKTKVKVLQNSTALIEEELLYTVKKEAGKSLGTFNFTYKPKTSSFQILHAETRNQDEKSLLVTSDKIEDKALASGLQGFDDSHQVIVNFPGIRIGSSLYMKTKEEVHTFYVKNLWSLFANYWAYIPVLKGSTLEIESEVPLFFHLEAFDTKIKDQLQITSNFDHEKKFYSLKMTAKEDIFYSLVEESDVYDDEIIPYFLTSTKESYEIAFFDIAKTYEEKLIYKSTPSSIKSFIKDLGKEKDLLEDARVLMSRIIDAIRYQGDWRTVGGAIIPRSFEEIEATEYGDCKDFSALLVSSLRELGYEAYPALVRRGAYDLTSLKEFPIDSHFNHAIVYALDKNKKAYFFDPTNTHSFSKVPMYDISGRKALVLKKGNPFLADIRETEAEDGIEFLQLDIFLGEKNISKVNVRDYFSGLSAISSANRLKGSSYEEASFGLTASYVGQANIVSIEKANFPKELLTSSLVASDFKIEVDATFFFSPLKTSFGKAYTFDSALSFFANLNPEKYTGGIFLPQISTMKKEDRLKGKSLIPFDFKDKQTIISPWFEYTREVRQDGRDILMIDDLKYLKRVITHKELHSKEFKDFQEVLRIKMENLALIYK